MREQFTTESVKRTRAEAEITRLQGMSGAEIAAHVDALRQRVAAVRQQVDEAERDLRGKRRQLDELRGRIVETEDIALLQESGIYEYRHRLADAVAYKDHLDEVKKTAKSLVREGAAVSSSTTWSVNGSQREGQKMVRDFSKLMLRAYREKARLLKERAHFESALARVRERGEDTAELEARLALVDEAITGVENREANIRAGYVYVISNIGAFGPDMVKIGLTRRLDPQDRIRELGDASVPFKFDTHALVFSEDAVTMETRLHQEFAERRVNQVNLRREFFRVTPAEVRNALNRFAGQHLLEFQELPEAAEWRASGGGRQELANA